MSSKLIRLEPFSDLTPFEAWPAMQDFFRSLRHMQLHDPAPQIRLDVTEDEKGYLVMAEIPGVKKDDIKVDIEHDLVTIRAESSQEKQQKEKTMVRSERSYGLISRTFRLVHEVDAAHSTASYKDGVLYLTLLKKAGTSSATQLKVS